MALGGWRAISRDLLLVLWKNYLFRKRRPVLTFFEIFIPTMMFIIFVSVLHYVGNESQDPKSMEKLDLVSVQSLPEKIHPKVNEDELKPPSCSRSKCQLAYTPVNERTNSLMNNLLESNSGKDNNYRKNKFVLKGYSNEREIEAAVSMLSKNMEEEITFAIVFQKGVEPPEPTISYKIRLTGSGSYSSRESDTDDLFPRMQGRRSYGEDDGIPYQKFSWVQLKLDKILIQELTNPNVTIGSRSVQKFPSSSGTFSYFGRSLERFLPIMFICGYFFIVPSTMLNIVSEKHNGIKELMKMMGLPNWMHWLGWMVNSMFVHIFSVTIIVICLCSSGSSTEAILKLTDPFLLWVGLCLYLMSATAFLFFLSSLVQLPIIASIIGMIIWLVTYIATALPLTDNYHSLTLTDQMAASLLPNYALHLFIRTIVGFELKAVGSKWSNIDEGLSSVDKVSTGYMFLMFIVDTIIYICLAIYFETILPSNFGVRKPFYYIFLPSTWITRRKLTRVSRVVPSSMDDEDYKGFETEPINLHAGVEIRNLVKRFGKAKVAVDRVSLKMFDGQITILLGHNGAGKTTTMSMLTGLIAPSSGTAIINGYDINTQMAQVRSSLGLCPQHNLLFDKLTCLEHLMFFGRLKGLTGKQAKQEASFLLSQMKMFEKANVDARSLSGGQKRKLSLGIALIGGTKVLILDEPTSGMDPEARRAIWDILLAMRGSRTILLTTHFMEEADILGDRIAIMAAGRVQCCGTPAFLKRYYGAGYTLAMTTAPDTNKEDILASVQGHVPTAFWKSEGFTGNSEISITIPNDGQTTSLFPEMFSDLIANKEKLGILTMGISLTTMDDVFVKVGEEAEPEHKRIGITPGTQSGEYPIPKPPKTRHEHGFKLILLQIWSLLVKKFLYTIRKPTLFISQFLVPLPILIGAVLLMNTFQSPGVAPPALKMSLSDYKDTISFYSSDASSEVGSAYEKLIESFGGKVEYISSNISAALLTVGRRDEGSYRANYIVAAEFSDELNAMFSGIPNHASPLSINLVTNAILKSLLPDANIEVTTHPLVDELYLIPNRAEKSRGELRFEQFLFIALLTMGLGIFSASFIILPLEESLCKGKQLQMMTGVSPFVYWGVTFFWDFMILVTFTCASLACIAIFETFETFSTHNGLGVVCLIFLAFGFSAISFSYMCSLFLKTLGGGFVFVTTIHLLLAVLPLPVAALVAQEVDYGVPYSHTIRFIGRFFPSFGLGLCFYEYFERSFHNSKCKVIPDELQNYICQSGSKVDSHGRISSLFQCCDQCKRMNLSDCFEPKPYLEWNTTYESTHYNDKSVLVTNQYHAPFLGEDLFFLFLIGILFSSIVILVEFGILRKVQDFLFKAENFNFRPPEDSDVVEEANRVIQLVTSGQVNQDALVVTGFCKSYASFSAVSNLSFGVHYGECFGLLGVNGAGKTTTFGMLTGDVIRSAGNAYGFNCTLEKNKNKFLSNIGYCPQFDGILGVLTGHEMLNLFARLRGIPAILVRNETNKILTKMGLFEAGNVKCKNYSGGMKRRLSAGIALIGDPQILLLDEPTSGVDPVSRRQFWKVLAEVRDSGQSIILTSHSMDECEALCSRLGIMVNGQFQCLGGVQHLKSKFAQGFSLFIKLQPLVPVQSPQVFAIQAEINEKLSPAVLRDQHQNVLHYQILNTSLPWDVLFQVMEDMKQKNENIIEEYSVNATTLEEVFLAFAREQQPQRITVVPCCKKCITCQCIG